MSASCAGVRCPSRLAAAAWKSGRQAVPNSRLTLRSAVAEHSCGEAAPSSRWAAYSSRPTAAPKKYRPEGNEREAGEAKGKQ